MTNQEKRPLPHLIGKQAHARPIDENGEFDDMASELVTIESGCYQQFDQIYFTCAGKEYALIHIKQSD